jgi:hypothetical protein
MGAAAELAVEQNGNDGCLPPLTDAILVKSKRKGNSMANLIFGTLAVEGLTGDIARLIEETLAFDGEAEYPISPEKILPVPEGVSDKDRVKWKSENWGTKSLSYNPPLCQDTDDSNATAWEFNEGDTEVEFELCSAWDPPLSLLDILFKRFSTLKATYFFSSYEDCNATLIEYTDSDLEVFAVNEEEGGSLSDVRADEDMDKTYKVEWKDGVRCQPKSNNIEELKMEKSYEDYTAKEWENLEGKDWSLLLQEHPQYEDKCDWSKLDAYNWTILLRGQPQFAEYCDWSKLETSSWAILLGSQPQFAEYCDFSLLDGDDWCTLLEYQPQFSEYCDWSQLDVEGYEWSSLLSCQPQFSEYCDWSKLDGEDWCGLLAKQPQYIEKCDWGKIEEMEEPWDGWYNLLEAQPQFVDRFPWEEAFKEICHGDGCWQNMVMDLLNEHPKLLRVIPENVLDEAVDYVDFDDVWSKLEEEEEEEVDAEAQSGLAEEAEFSHNALLINISKSVEDNDLYEAIRFAWKLSIDRAEQAEIILGVSKGIIRCAFVSKEWLPATTEYFPGREGVPGRYGFVGMEAPAEIKSQYVGKSVPAEYRKRGASNPIKYTY